MLGDGRKHRLLIFVREENLKRMSSQKHQIEMAAEPKTLCIRLNPSNPLASWLSSGNFEHGHRGVDSNDDSAIGQPCR